jgi:hypothetical protein
LKELGAAAPPKDGAQWRINFSRVEWDTEVADGKYRKVKGKPEHNWVWSPQGVIDMHRPERWGYLQFSTAKPGTAEFREDPEWDHRDLLHRAYYAQRVYLAKNGKYAPTAAELGLKDAGTVSLEVTRHGFEASVNTHGASRQRWTITQDSRIWRE